MNADHILTPRRKRVRDGSLVLIALACLMLVMTVAFFRFTLTHPVDGGRIDNTLPSWQPEGILVMPMETEAGGLRPGDLVLAAGGVSMEDWAKRLFLPQYPAPDLEFGQTVDYSVDRGGQPIIVPVAYIHYPLGWLIANHWGNIVFALATQVIAAFVFWRRPEDPAARLLFVWSWLGCMGYVWSIGLQTSSLIDRAGFWYYSFFSQLLWVLYWCVAVHFALVFPEKSNFILKHPRKIALLYLAAFVIWFAYTGISFLRSASILVYLGSWNVAGYLIAFIYLAIMVGVIIFNYRSDAMAETSREKIRWVVYGAFISGFGALVFWILPPILLDHPIISANLMGVLVTVFPVTVGIAVLRHGLFDIDLIINRTLVYSLLSGLLAVVFLVSVVSLQIAFRALTGQESQLAVVVSTLTIVFLFSPFRRAIQELIDRRFFRRKYDAEKTREIFAANVRNQVELDQIKDALMEAVDQTLKPKHAHLWLNISTTGFARFRQPGPSQPHDHQTK